MNNINISRDIKNIIIKYTLPPINKLKELEHKFKYYIGRIRMCLDMNCILKGDFIIKPAKNFNNTKYKRIHTLYSSYWTLRLKTDL